MKFVYYFTKPLIAQRLFILGISNGIDFTRSGTFFDKNRFGVGFYTSLDKSTPLLENTSATSLLTFKTDLSSMNIFNACSTAGKLLTNSRIGSFALKQFSLASRYDAILARSVKESGGFNLIFINQESVNNAVKLSENFSLKSSSKAGMLNLP